MRICCIANANMVHTWRWVQPLVEGGHEVEVLSYTPPARSLPGVRVVDLTRISNVPRLRFVRWGAWIWRHVRHTRPDVLHAFQLTGAGWIGVMAGYHPLVVSSWGSDLLLEPGRSALRRLLLTTVLKRSDALTVPTALLHEKARALGVPDAKMVTIPWGIESDVFRPDPADRPAARLELGIADQAPVVLAPRAMTALYNLDTVVDAFQALVRRLPAARLILIEFNADPAYAAALRRKIQDLGVHDLVLWLPPRKTMEDMARLYRAADVLVSVPSSEGYGFSVLEAMASGLPAVISDLPVFGDLVDGRHVLKVPARDPLLLAGALDRVLTDAALCEVLRANAFELSQGMSVQHRVQRVNTLYETLQTEWRRGR